MAKEHGSLVTVRELLPLLPEDATEEELTEAMRVTPALNAKFELRSGFVTERSGVQSSERVIAEEQHNRRSAGANLWWATQFAKWLHSTPFTMVGVSGSTSYRSASKSRDLDMFCVASSGLLWTALTEGLVLARIFRILNPRCPEICLSCLMDESFALPLFRKDQGLLFARDALATVVLKGESTYTWLLEEGSWISGPYPKAYSAKMATGSARTSKPGSPSLLAKLVERILFFVVRTYMGAKSNILNKRFAGKGEFENVFVVRSSLDHLIYESRRYSRLKQMYSGDVEPGTLGGG